MLTAITPEQAKAYCQANRDAHRHYLESLPLWRQSLERCLDHLDAEERREIAMDLCQFAAHMVADLCRKSIKEMGDELSQLVADESARARART